MTRALVEVGKSIKSVVGKNKEINLHECYDIAGKPPGTIE